MSKELLDKLNKYLISLDELNSTFPMTKEYLKSKNVKLVSQLSDKDKEGLQNHLNAVFIVNEALVNRET